MNLISIASLFISICSLGLTFYYNKKNYKAQVINKSKIDDLNTVRLLILDFVSNMDSAIYYSFRAYENALDSKNDGIKFVDSDKRVQKVKDSLQHLDVFLNFENDEELRTDIKNIAVYVRADKLSSCFSSNTTGYKVYIEETKYQRKYNAEKEKLLNDLEMFYKNQLKNLVH